MIDEVRDPLRVSNVLAHVKWMENIASGITERINGPCLMRNSRHLHKFLSCIPANCQGVMHERNSAVGRVNSIKLPSFSLFLVFFSILRFQSVEAQELKIHSVSTWSRFFFSLYLEFSISDVSDVLRLYGAPYIQGVIMNVFRPDAIRSYLLPNALH